MKQLAAYATKKQENFLPPLLRPLKFSASFFSSYFLFCQFTTRPGLLLFRLHYTPHATNFAKSDTYLPKGFTARIPTIIYNRY